MAGKNIWDAAPRKTYPPESAVNAHTTGSRYYGNQYGQNIPSLLNSPSPVPSRPIHIPASQNYPPLFRSPISVPRPTQQSVTQNFPSLFGPPSRPIQPLATQTFPSLVRPRSSKSRAKRRPAPAHSSPVTRAPTAVSGTGSQPPRFQLRREKVKSEPKKQSNQRVSQQTARQQPRHNTVQSDPNKQVNQKLSQKKARFQPRQHTAQSESNKQSNQSLSLQTDGLRFRDKVVIVTGGSAGIGEGCVRVFVRQGGKVVFCSRTKDDGFNLMTEMNKTGPGEAKYISANIKSPGQVKNLITRTIQHYGRIDCLINSAGSRQERQAIDDIKHEEFRDLIDLNVLGCFNCCQQALPHLRKTQGSIINISSIVNALGQKESLTYCATKGAVSALTRSLAIDEARHGVRVNTVSPGNIWTPLWQHSASKFPDVEKRIEDGANSSLFGRFGKIEEVGNMCLFLATDATFCSGGDFNVSGGSELNFGHKSEVNNFVDPRKDSSYLSKNPSHHVAAQAPRNKLKRRQANKRKAESMKVVKSSHSSETKNADVEGMQSGNQTSLDRDEDIYVPPEAKALKTGEIVEAVEASPKSKANRGAVEPSSETQTSSEAVETISEAQTSSGAVEPSSETQSSSGAVEASSTTHANSGVTLGLCVGTKTTE